MRLPDMTDYEGARREVRFQTLESRNFGLDLIGRRAERSDKTACVSVDATGVDHAGEAGGRDVPALQTRADRQIAPVRQRLAGPDHEPSGLPHGKGVRPRRMIRKAGCRRMESTDRRQRNCSPEHDEQPRSGMDGDVPW